MRAPAPVRYPIKNESLEGEQGGDGEWYMFSMTATDQDGATATLTIIHDDRPHARRPYRVVDPGAIRTISDHPTFDRAVKDTSVRLRKWLASGRRMKRIRDARERQARP